MTARANTFSALTLFSGGGLVEVGLRACGLTPVGAVEIDAACCEWHTRNHGSPITCAAVEDVDYRPWSDVDLLWASPSCRNASVANTAGEESAGDLTAAAAIARCLCETRPRWFVLENVPAYRRFSSFAAVTGALDALGYWWSAELWCASDYAVPQTRKRLFLRACREGMFLPKPPPIRPKLGWYSAIEDLLPTLSVSRLAPWQQARMPEPLRTCLAQMKNTGQAWGDGTRGPAEPAPSLTTDNRPSHWPQAVLVGQQTSGADHAPQQSLMDEPAHPVTASLRGKGKMPQAILFGGSNTSRELAAPGVGVSDAGEPARAVAPNSDRWKALLLDGRQSHPGAGPGERGGVPRADAEPWFCIGASSYKSTPQVLLVDGQNARGPGHGGLTTVPGATPSFTLTNAAKAVPRVMVTEAGEGEGYVVLSLTPRALARLMTVPDWYELPSKNALACRILGQGVPCRLAEAVVRSLIPPPECVEALPVFGIRDVLSE